MLNTVGKASSCLLSLVTSNSSKHGNSRKVQSQRRRRSSCTTRSAALYAGAVLVALTAGTCHLAMQRALQDLSDRVQVSVRMWALDFLEHVEVDYGFAERIHYTESEEHFFDSKAQQLAQKSKVEEMFATRDRIQGENYLKMAEEQKLEAQLHWDKAQQEDDSRLAHLANMNTAEHQEAEYVDEMRQIHQGTCEWNMVFSAVCNTLGGIAHLQEKANLESLKIQQEWSEAEAADKDETMNQLVASMLQGKADDYTKTANKLLAMASVWEERSKRDHDEAIRDNETATELEHEVEELEDEEDEDDHEIDSEMGQIISQLLLAAEKDRTNAYLYAAIALFSALLALPFFLYQATPRALALLETSIQLYSENFKEEEARRKLKWISFCIQHLLIFLLVVGLIGEYFIYLERYEVPQRAVIVVWFSFLASMLQVFVLHCIPVVWSQSLDDIDWRPIALVAGRTLAFLIPLFLIEILQVWLSFGHALFCESVVRVVGSFLFRLLSILSMVFHLWYFQNQIESESEGSGSDDQMTLPTTLSYDSSHISVSEATPLRKADMVSMGTDIEIRFDAGNDDDMDSVSTLWSSSGLSPLIDDLYRLVLPFEVLVSSTMIAILRGSIQLLTTSRTAWLPCLDIFCAIFLIGFACYAAMRFCSGSTRSSHSSKTLPTNNTIGYELVQV